MNSKKRRFDGYSDVDLLSGSSFTVGDLTVNNLSPYGAVLVDASKKLTSQTLTNGQLLIGSTGALPISATITGTSNQINVANASGSIVLSTPQNLDTAANVTFNNAIISGLSASQPVIANASKQLTTLPLTNGQLLIGSTGLSPVASTITGTSNQINVANASGSIVLSAPQDLNTSSNVTFNNATLSGLSASQPVIANASKQLTTLPLTNGQLLIGSTGSSPVAATITGTSNRISVANSNGSITLSAPQDIGTASTVTFQGAFINSLTASSIVVAAANKALDTRTLTDGQLLIGSTGNVPVAASITGSVNGISVTNGSGSISLSTPQAIATTSSPTFAGLTVNSTTFSNVTSGYVAAPLSYYETYTNTSNWGGAFAITNVIVNITRIGNIVVMHIPENTGAGVISSNIVGTPTTYLPARLRPTYEVSTFFRVRNNGSALAYPGFLNILVDGTIRVFVDPTGGTNWSNTGTNGWIGAMTATWLI